jgi:hypothetical protein
MVRLQILELPEGSGDERPPYLLIIDQVDEGTADDIARWPDDIAKRTGARHVLCFTETVEIPVNEVPVNPDGYPVKLRIEPDFETFREQAQEEIRKAQADITRAIEDAKLRAASEEGWTGRPTRPDGTPYGYSEITEGGWEPCEGCRTWGQWTAENPHNCPGTYIKGPIAKPATDA